MPTSLFSTSTVLDVPRPFIDPITTIPELLVVASLVHRRPTRSSTITITMDHERRGLNLSVHGAPTVDTFHDIVAEVSAIEHARFVALITTRMRHPATFIDPTLIDAGRMILAGAGFILDEWIVAGNGGFDVRHPHVDPRR